MGSCLSNPRPRRGCSPEPRRSPSAQSMILLPWGRTWSRAPSLTRIAMGCSRCRSARGPCTGGHPTHGLCCPSTGWSCRGPCAGPVATSRSGSTRPSLTSWPVVPIRSARRAGSTPTSSRRTRGSMSWAGRTRSRPGRTAYSLAGCTAWPSAACLRASPCSTGCGTPRRSLWSGWSSGCPTALPRVLDVQWCTDHLCSLGVVGVPRADYLARLPDVLALPRPAFVVERGGC